MRASAIVLTLVGAVTVGCGAAIVHGAHSGWQQPRQRGEERTSSAIQITNRSRQERLCAIELRPAPNAAGGATGASGDGWQAHTLGPDGIGPLGVTEAIEVDAGRFEVRVRTCDGRQQELPPVEVPGGAVLVSGWVDP